MMTSLTDTLESSGGVRSTRAFFIAEEDHHAFREGIAGFLSCPQEEVTVRAGGRGVDLLAGPFSVPSDADRVFIEPHGRLGKPLPMSPAGGQLRLDKKGAGLWALSVDGSITYYLAHAEGVELIPETFTGGLALHAPELEVLPRFAALRSIQTLSAEDLLAMTDVSALEEATGLEYLSLDNCPIVPGVPSLRRCIGLTSISLNGCRKIEDFSFLQYIPSLVAVDLGRCDRLKDLSPLRGLHGLTSVSLRQCKRLASLLPLAGLTALTTIDLTGCKVNGAADLSCFSALLNLKSLKLGWFRDLSSLAPLVGLTALNELDLGSANALTDLSPLASLKQLTSLTIGSCDALTDISPLGGLPRLATLAVKSSNALTDLNPLSGLARLTSVRLGSCKNLTDIGPLAPLATLKSLKLGSCRSLTDLKPLAALTSLTVLDLGSSNTLTDLSSLKSLVRLKSLRIGACGALTDLAAIAGFSDVASLTLGGASSLVDLRPIGGLSCLTSLELGGCAVLTDISPLVGLRSLKELTLSGCDKLTNLQPIAGLKGLISLKLSSCKAVADLSPLAEVMTLRCIDLSECPEVLDVAPVGRLTRVTTFTLSRCESIHDATLFELAKCPMLSTFACDRPLSALRVRLAVECEHGCRHMTRDDLNSALNVIRKVESHRSVALIALFAKALRRSYTAEPWVGVPLSGLIDVLAQHPSPSVDATTDVVELLMTLAATEPSGLSTTRHGIERILVAVASRLRTHTSPLLCPLLRRIPDLPAELRRPIAARVRETLEGLALPTMLPLLRRIAPAVAVFWSRMGDAPEVTRWLDLASQGGEPLFRDDVLLALAIEDIAAGRLDDAERRLDTIQVQNRCDQLRKHLVMALAVTDSARAGAHLDRIHDPEMRQQAAAALLGDPCFLSDIANFYNVAEAIHRDPEALGVLIQQAALIGQIPSRLAAAAHLAQPEPTAFPTASQPAMTGFNEHLARLSSGMRPRARKEMLADIINTLEKNEHLNPEEIAELRCLL